MLLGLFVLLAVGLLLVNVKPAWALGLTPSSPIAGQSFIVSGILTCGLLLPPCTAALTLYSGSGCNSANMVYSASQMTLPNGVYSFTVPGQVAGPYTVQVATDVSGCFPFTIIQAATTPIPEYPLGLPILAVLTILAYGIIRRRTRN